MSDLWYVLLGLSIGTMLGAILALYLDLSFFKGKVEAHMKYTEFKINQLGRELKK